MDRLFLDANILFSAAYRPNAGLRQLWRLSGVSLLTSGYAVEEARRNLDTADQRRDLQTLLVNTHLQQAAELRQPLPDSVELPEKDEPIMLAAISAQATHLITGDVKHFGRYYGKRVEGVLILAPSAYLHPK